MFCVRRRDPMVNLNYAVFLYNLGDRKAAVKQFSVFEQKFQTLKSSNPSEIDQEVNGFTFIVCFGKAVDSL